MISAFFPPYIYTCIHAYYILYISVTADFFPLQLRLKGELSPFSCERHLKIPVSPSEICKRSGTVSRQRETCSSMVCNKGNWQRALEWNTCPREMLLMEGFCKLLSIQPYQTVPPQKQTLSMQKMAWQGPWYKWIVKISHRQAAG